jgi:hypothetical protein
VGRLASTAGIAKAVHSRLHALLPHSYKTKTIIATTPHHTTPHHVLDYRNTSLLHLVVLYVGVLQVGVTLAGGGRYFHKDDKDPSWSNGERPFMLSVEDPKDPDNDVCR